MQIRQGKTQEDKIKEIKETARCQQILQFFKIPLVIEKEGCSYKWTVTNPGYLAWAGRGGRAHRGLVWKICLSSKSQFLLVCIFTEEGVMWGAWSVWGQMQRRWGKLLSQLPLCVTCPWVTAHMIQFLYFQKNQVNLSGPLLLHL